MNKNYLQQINANIALLLTATISGLSFVAQKNGMDFVGPFTFNASRAFLGTLSLLPVIFIFKLMSMRNDKRKKIVKFRQRVLLAKSGFVCGLVLFLALTVNQFCMIYAPAGKAGFITSLYVIFVPIISFFMGRKLHLNVKISVILATIGLYLLCYKAGSPIELSDIFLLISAILFALHILCVGYYSHRVSSVKMSCLQFFVMFLFSLPCMFIIEHPEWASIVAGAKPILFSGIVVTAIAYTLQVFGQKYAPPVITALIMSLESVFAVVGGVWLLNEPIYFKEGCGCIIMLAAIILAQLDLKFRKFTFPALYRFVRRRIKKILSK